MLNRLIKLSTKKTGNIPVELKLENIQKLFSFGLSNCLKCVQQFFLGHKIVLLLINIIEGCKTFITKLTVDLL